MLTRSKSREVFCIFCLQVCQDQVARIQCSHSFCYSCLLEWTKDRSECPICKIKVDRIQKFYLKTSKTATRAEKRRYPEEISLKKIRKEKKQVKAPRSQVAENTSVMSEDHEDVSLFDQSFAFHSNSQTPQQLIVRYCNHPSLPVRPLMRFPAVCLPAMRQEVLTDK